MERTYVNTTLGNSPQHGLTPRFATLAQISKKNPRKTTFGGHKIAKIWHRF